MSKLRLVKERKHADETAIDLRGLGEEDFFKKSAPMACLTVHGLTRAQNLDPFLQKYDLVVEPSAHPHVVHLKHRRQNEGQHKVHAVMLFVAGLDILHHLPEAHLHLGQVDQLHSHLGSAIRRKNAKLSGPDQMTADWQRQPSAYSLAPVCTHHLHQAGFEIEAQKDYLHMNRLVAMDHHRKVTESASANQHVKVRRAG